ncbi:MAG TPA: hypothetical protein VNW15_15300 [Rhizomicrobium sp.]|jgi:hypothetical protein|nr:hypothetical protein [Rhizomicrobium sp.]
MDWEWLQKNGRLIMAAKWVILPFVVLAAGGGWWFADYHYRERIEWLNDQLEHKEFPKAPAPVVKEVPMPDPAQAAKISDLQDQLDKANVALKARRPPPKPAPKAAETSPSENCFNDLSGAQVGVANIDHNVTFGGQQAADYCNRGGSTGTLNSNNNYHYPAPVVPPSNNGK